MTRTATTSSTSPTWPSYADRAGQRHGQHDGQPVPRRNDGGYELVGHQQAAMPTPDTYYKPLGTHRQGHAD